MKPLVAFALFAAALTLSTPAFAARTDHPAPVWTVTSLHVENLTGDPLFTSAYTDSLARRLLALPRFEDASGGSSGSSLTSAFVWLPNPFRVDAAGADDSLAVQIDLDLEVTYYGPELEARTTALPTTALGPLGYTFWVEHFVGAVQWRATIHGPGPGTALVVLGNGSVDGKGSALDRRGALARANRRALYQLGWQMASALDRREHSPTKPTNTRGDQKEYLEHAEAW